MKFVIKKASDYRYSEVKEINTLEELMDFYKEEGAIIIDRYYCEDTNTEELGIMIYDDYLE